MESVFTSAYIGLNERVGVACGPPLVRLWSCDLG